MSYLDWKVGDKIVCVDDSESGSIIETYRLLQRDAIYTIAAISMTLGFYREEFGVFTVVELAEVKNRGSMNETRFAAARFRPVQHRRTSIEIFERLLNPSKEDTIRELEAEIFEYSDICVPFR